MRKVNRKMQSELAKSELAKLEESVRVQTKRKRIETAILGSVVLTGFMSCALMAPNAVSVLSKALPDLRPIKQKQSIKRAIGRLIKKGYLEKRNEKYCITDTGKMRLLILTSESQRVLIKRKWDKKWRVVIFDIPEKYRAKRDELRRALQQKGFVKIQNSVWAYPYQCNEIIALLKFNLKLGRSAVYMIVDAIEGDESLRKHFNLPEER